MAEPRCETCRFWFRDKPILTATNIMGRQTPTYCECRRHAPTPRDNAETFQSWSATLRDKWCGEYQPIRGK